MRLATTRSSERITDKQREVSNVSSVGQNSVELVALHHCCELFGFSSTRLQVNINKRNLLIVRFLIVKHPTLICCLKFNRSLIKVIGRLGYHTLLLFTLPLGHNYEASSGD